MANCIATCEGYDKDRTKDRQTLGSEGVKVRAATWNTDAVAYMNKDGSGYVEVRVIQSGQIIHRYDFGPESEREVLW